VPAPTKDTTPLVEVQTSELDGDVEIATGKPELAIAETAYACPPTVVVDGAVEVSVIDCTLFDGIPLRTENDCCTWGAARYLESPGWFALIVQVPAPRGVTVESATLHTPASAGSAENTTGNPDPAVADTTYGCPPAIASCGGVDVKTIV
jgi:hypothetical protein